VGYSTTAYEGAESLLPADMPANVRAKIQLDRMPYTGYLSDVALYASSRPISDMFTTAGYKRREHDLPIAVQAVDWLLNVFPDVWSNDLAYNGSRRVMFVGFEPKIFLKFLGIECMMAGQPIPLSLWYGNSDHRDLMTAVMPSEFKSLDWPIVFKAIRGTILDKEQLAKFDKLTVGWDPGVDAERDLAVSLELSMRLGMYSD
jgi:hypothetical protein